MSRIIFLTIYIEKLPNFDFYSVMVKKLYQSCSALVGAGLLYFNDS